MKQKWIYTAMLLMVSAISLQAQEHVDTVRFKPMTVSPVLQPPTLPLITLTLPDMEESKEARAARINQETYLRVMFSILQSLYWQPSPVSGTPLLSGPYSFRPGTVPVMSASNPFIYAVTPGMAPYSHPYSPDVFPQCIRTEVDFTSGTYKQTMVKWEDLQKSMARSFGGPYRLEPVPRLRSNTYVDHLIP